MFGVTYMTTEWDSILEESFECVHSEVHFDRDLIATRQQFLEYVCGHAATTYEYDGDDEVELSRFAGLPVSYITDGKQPWHGRTTAEREIREETRSPLRAIFDQAREDADLEFFCGRSRGAISSLSGTQEWTMIYLI